MKKGECYGGLYRVIRPLGQGGQGSVSLVFHERSLRLMALKEVPLNGRAWDSLEKSCLCHLAHRGLPRIYDVFLENGKGYLAMEYIPGWNLKDYKEKKGDLSSALLLKLSGELAEILLYLHGRTPPLIHGDIKPGNLILKENGELVLVDFGSALKKNGERRRIYATRGFSAPEQLLRFGRVDTYSDIYSFGRTFQYLSGRKKGALGLRRIYRKCTAKDPKKRYRSAEALLRAIRFYERRTYLYSILLCLGACVFLTAGTVCQKITAVRQEQRVYQEAVFSNNISEIKSAIQSSPGREEGYRKLLEVYLSDGIFQEEEAMELEAEMAEGEEALVSSGVEYSGICYEIGLAYWYYYEGESGKIYSTAWFQKALSGELEEEREERAELYVSLGSFYEGKNRRERTGEGTFSYEAFFSTLERMTEAMIGSKQLEGEWAKELIGRLYESGEEFAEAGIEKQRAFALLEKGRKGLPKEEQRNWDLTAKWLDGVYERMEET